MNLFNQIGESFRSLVEEVAHMRKHQLTTHLAGMSHITYGQGNHRRKVSSMYGQWYDTEEPSRVQEEYDPKVHGESAEKELQSAISGVGEQSALLLMAVETVLSIRRS